MLVRQSHSLLHKSVFALALCVFATALGCEAKEEIRRYNVAKQPAEPSTTPVADSTVAPAEAPGEPTDRMLAAIVPVGDRAYFFKVVGPIAVVDERKDEITAFFSNLKVVDGRPTWTAPEGWKEDAASEMRTATLWVPTDGEPLEMSVIPLPWRGTQAELLSNVNRWREQQMRLPPIQAAQLKDNISEIKAGDTTITLVDLSGRYSGGMMAPFAGGRSGAPNRPAPRSGTDLPPGHPPVDSSGAAPRTAPPTADAAADVPKFEAPKSWRPVPASGLRKAEFAIGSNEQDGFVRLTAFPTNAGPLMTDPLANVNRWRGEIGLPTIEKDQLGESTESIEIDGKPAEYVRLIPDTSKPEHSKIKQATLAAMVTAGDQIWFIKLFGPRDTVVDEEENFKAFLTSMQFADGSGERNGDK
jgi:hypothetical protein